jgi:polysaccharide export outer membrane protein
MKKTDDSSGQSHTFPPAVLWLLLLVMGVVVGVGSGCASNKDQAAMEATLVAGSPAYSREVLHEGDVIAITCESVSQINSTNKIPINGKLDLAFVGQVEAAGKSTRQLQEELLKAYSKQVRADVITVKVIESASAVYVAGAVLRPGKIPLDRPMTALEAIMEAGGYDPNRAKLSKVTVIRVKNEKQATYHLDLTKALSGEETTPFYLQPFDTVQVPNRTFNW